MPRPDERQEDGVAQSETCGGEAHGYAARTTTFTRLFAYRFIHTPGVSRCEIMVHYETNSDTKVVRAVISLK